MINKAIKELIRVKIPDNKVKKITAKDVREVLDLINQKKANDEEAGVFTSDFTVFQTGNPNRVNGLEVKKGDSISEFLRKVFRKSDPRIYQQPSVWIEGTPNVGLEIGQRLQVQLVGKFNKGEAGDAVSVKFYKDGEFKADGYALNDIITVSAIPVKYSFRVDYAEGPVLPNDVGEPSPENHIVAGQKTAERSYSGNLYSFAGMADEIPAEGSRLRTMLWEGRKFGSSQFSITTNGNRHIVVALPNGRTLLEGKNTATNEVLNFTAAVMKVPDASGALHDYNVYTQTNALAFTPGQEIIIKTS